MAKIEEITLGSGTFYIDEFVAGAAIPEDAVIEVEDKRLSHTKGGASLEYTSESFTEKSDDGLVSKTVITEEDVVIKAGLVAWDGNDLAKLCSTARVVEDTTKGTRTVKVGGIGNDNGKSYLIRFVQESKRIRVTIVGKNQAGFTLAFATDEGTKIEPEFKAQPIDAEGTLLIFSEKIPKIV